MIFFVTLTVRGPLHRKDFKWKKYGGTGLISEKVEVLYAELNKRGEAATSNYSDSLQYFILCLYLGIIGTSDQGVYFMNFPWIFLSNQLCKPRPTIANINSDKTIFYPFTVSVNNCGGSCKTIDDLYDQVCLSK